MSDCILIGQLSPDTLPNPLPMAISVRAGQSHFPSPAQDYEQEDVDIIKKLMPNRPATFLFHVEGESMTGIGIYPGSTLIVDKSLTPVSGSIVVVDVEGEWMVKRLLKGRGSVQLLSENTAYPTITLSEDQQLFVFGVVTYVIHRPE